MKTYTTEGIVCSSIKLGESDRIVSIYTRQGLVRAVAKGVRKTKSKFGGRLEPFSHVRLMLHRGRSLHTVSQAELVAPYSNIRRNLDLLAYGSAMLNLVEKMGEEESHPGELLDTLEEALRFLAEGTHPLLVLCAFELRVISLLGYLPNFDTCTSCGETVSEREVSFSAKAGGFLCPYCALTDELSLRLAPITVRLFRELTIQGMYFVPTIHPASAGAQELHRVLHLFLRYHLDINLRSFRFLKGFAEEPWEDWGERPPPVA